MQRLIAVNILKRVIEQQLTLKESFNEETQFANHPDKAFIAELCYGVCRYYPQLKLILSSLLKSSLKAKDLDIELLLLCGFYQLRNMTITDYAAINETVETCKRLKKLWAKGLVNATLRNYTREHESIDAAYAHKDGYRYALPEWYLQLLTPTTSDIDNIGEALLERAPIYLRVNLKKIAADDYVTLLEEHNYVVDRVSGLDECLRLTSSQGLDVAALPGFDKGYVSVQDIAPQYASKLLDVTHARGVLDACSAPGGKLCHMLEQAPATTSFTALDVSANRVQRIKENLTRLEQEARVVVGNGLDAQTLFEQQTFDRIMLDAPCSASGVIRRHPDIKLLRSKADVMTVTVTQQALLESLWPLLEANGLLLYCTCSLFDVENDQQIERFLSTHQDATIQAIDLPIGSKTRFGIQCLPPQGDGFYYALLKKSAV